MTNLTVEIVEMDELKLVGLPVNVTFAGDKSIIRKTFEEFIRIRHEIKNCIHPDHRYICPWYSCEVMFTYFYCMEVSKFEDIPDRMMELTIPARRYASIYYDGPKPFDPDPYAQLHIYKEQNQLKHKDQGMNLEIYWFDKECTENKLVLTVCEPIEYIK